LESLIQIISKPKHFQPFDGEMSATRKTFVSEGFARVRAALRQRFVDEESEVVFRPEANPFT